MTKHYPNLVKTTINIQGKLISLAKPIVMGIINVTPDSFYQNSRTSTVKSALAMAEQMISEGATLLDVGGFSTRPGAKEVTEAEEINRVIPVIKGILTTFPEALISVDTFRARVAEQCIAAGAVMINDITAGSEPAMLPLVAQSKIPYIIMHMRGPVTNMMADLVYQNLLLDITKYFQERLTRLKEMGVEDVIIDPGFGFSKSLDQNYEILKNLTYFEALGTPILVGVSRKSLIYNLLGTTADDALSGTSVLNFAALEKGARILRVHDVKETMDTIKIFNKINS